MIGNNQTIESSFNQLGFSETLNKNKVSVFQSHRDKPEPHRERENEVILDSAPQSRRDLQEVAPRYRSETKNPNFLFQTRNRAATETESRRAAEQNRKTLICDCQAAPRPTLGRAAPPANQQTLKRFSVDFSIQKLNFNRSKH